MLSDTIFTLYFYLKNTLSAPAEVLAKLIEYALQGLQGYAFIGLVAFGLSTLASLGGVFTLQFIAKIIKRGVSKNTLLAVFLALLSTHILAGVTLTVFSKTVSNFIPIHELSIISFVLVVMGTASLPYYLFWQIKKRLYSQVNKLTRSLDTILLVYPLALALILIIDIVFDPLGPPQGNEFFNIHAAIKNTCLDDPEQINCPQKVEDISFIEPEEYQKLSNTQASYLYDKSENRYTLVVRYSRNRAVLFDPRLKETLGRDFEEYQLHLIGRDKLASPPPFEGPWEFDPWPY